MIALPERAGYLLALALRCLFKALPSWRHCVTGVSCYLRGSNSRYMCACCVHVRPDLLVRCVIVSCDVAPMFMRSFLTSTCQNSLVSCKLFFETPFCPSYHQSAISYVTF